TMIEFSAPDVTKLTGARAAAENVPIPLLFARKQLRQGFRVCDEGGRLVPILTRAESMRVELEMITSLAETLLAKRDASAGGPTSLDPNLRCEILSVVESDQR